MNHEYDSNDTLLTDFALGELALGERADAERAEVERRLATDDEARHELEELTQLAGMLRTATIGGEAPAFDDVSETVASIAANPELHAALRSRLASDDVRAADGAQVAVGDPTTSPTNVRRPRLPADVARRRSTAWAVAASIGVLVTGFGTMALIDDDAARQGRLHEAEGERARKGESERVAAGNRTTPVGVASSTSRPNQISFTVAKPTYEKKVESGPSSPGLGLPAPGLPAPGLPAPSGVASSTAPSEFARQNQGTIVINTQTSAGAGKPGQPSEPVFVPYSNDLQLFDSPDLSTYGNGVRAPTGWFGSAEYLNWSIAAPDKTAVGNPALSSLRVFNPGVRYDSASTGDRSGRGTQLGRYGESTLGHGYGGGGMGGGGGGGAGNGNIGGLGGYGAAGGGQGENLQNFSYYVGMEPRRSASEYTPFVTRDLTLQPTVQEAQTGRFMLGVGINSNSGLLGSIVLDEQNSLALRSSVATPNLATAVTNRPTSTRVDVGAVNVFTQSGSNFAAAVPEGTLGESPSVHPGYVTMSAGVRGPIIHSPTPAVGLGLSDNGTSNYTGGTVILRGANTFGGATTVNSDFTSGGRFEFGRVVNGRGWMSHEYNSFTGGVVLNGGTLNLAGNDGSKPSDGPVAFNRSDSVHSTGVITGNGTLPALPPPAGFVDIQGGDVGTPAIGNFNNFRFVGDGFDDDLDGDGVYGRFGRDRGTQPGLTFTNPLAGIPPRGGLMDLSAGADTLTKGIRIRNSIPLPALVEAERTLAGYTPQPERSREIELKVQEVAQSLEEASSREVAELAGLSEGRELARIVTTKQQVFEEKLVPLLAREKAARVEATRNVSALDEVRDLEQRVLAVTNEIESLRRLEETEAERVRLWKELEDRSEAKFHTDAFDTITENPFVRTGDEPLSTFSIDVDTASYSIVRSMLNSGTRPPRGAVRLEEFVNYFPYDYPQPEGDDPFSVNTEAARCPWNADHVLVRVGLKGKEIHRQERPASNLVFLVDVSGSMTPENKLPLVRKSLKKLVNELSDSDRVAIVVYAGNTGLVLPSTGGNRKPVILDAIDRMNAGGSTNGGAGIELAYQIALDNFIKGGVNRVILATDGDFNVGVTSQTDLVDLIERKAKTGIFFTALGYGMGNLKDSTLEKLADKGNGNYGYIDTIEEAHKVLVEQMSGTLVTIAKDVKIQIEFNPNRVAGYRLLGYENRMLAAQDFNDDKKDAGEIGAGHTVTALYELIPAGKAAKQETAKLPTVDPLKYQQPQDSLKPTAAAESKELLTLKLRYKQPDGDKSKLIERTLQDDVRDYAKASGEFKFAASVATFGMVLRRSAYRGTATLDAALELAQEGMGKDPFGYRLEFLDLIRKAKGLAK